MCIRDSDEAVVASLLMRLDGDVDRSVEHQAMYALIRAGQTAPLITALRVTNKPALQRRALMVLNEIPSAHLSAEDLLPLLEANDSALANCAATIVAGHSEWISPIAARLGAWLKD